MSNRFSLLMLALVLSATITSTARAQTPPAPPPTLTVPRNIPPNLIPVRLNPKPLLRKINPLKTGITMVDSAFCSGLADNETREVAVPDFEWCVVNDNRRAINTPFSVTLSGTPSGVVTTSPTSVLLSTQQVTSIPVSSKRTFRNWSGRPTRIRVVRVTGEPLLSDEYEGSAGCYLLPPATASSFVVASPVALDPKPLIIRVDSAKQIGERVETDNELIIP